MLLLALILAVTACVPLPRPFKPESKNPDNPLLQLPDSGGVVVAPLQDAPPAAGPFAELLAESLLRVGIPASTTADVEKAFLLEGRTTRSEEQTSELQTLMRNSYAVFCLQKKKTRAPPMTQA